MRIHNHLNFLKQSMTTLDSGSNILINLKTVLVPQKGKVHLLTG